MIRQVAPICQAIVIIIVTTLKPVTALPSAEISVSMCSTSLPEPLHMSGFFGNSIKLYVLIEWRHFLRENVYSTGTSSCDLYIWSNFIHKVTSSDDVCPPWACITAIAVLLLHKSANSGKRKQPSVSGGQFGKMLPGSYICYTVV